MSRLLKGWEVEWCAGCPERDGDTDLDAADMRFRDFATRDAAMKYAQEVLPKDFFGQVTVNEFEMVPFEPGFPGLTRDYLGQPEHIS